MRIPQKQILSVVIGLAFILLQVAESYSVSHGPATLHMDSGTISFLYSAANSPSPPPKTTGQKFHVIRLEITDHMALFPELILLPPQREWQDLLPSRASPA